MGLKVPISLLHQVCYVRSSPRLPKRRIWDEPKEAVIDYAARSPVKIVRESTDESDYRYWALKPRGNNFDYDSVCRACEFNFVGAANRKAHFGRTSCAKLIECAGEFLKLGSKKCLICNAAGSKEKWGVPLCSSTCENVWRLSIPLVFSGAIRKIKTMPQGTKVGHVTVP